MLHLHPSEFTWLPPLSPLEDLEIYTEMMFHIGPSRPLLCSLSAQSSFSSSGIIGGTPQRGTRLELEHLARRTLGTVWSRRGGCGLEPRLHSLGQQRSIGAMVDPQKATAWPTSDESREFVHRSSQDWCRSRSPSALTKSSPRARRGGRRRFTPVRAKPLPRADARIRRACRSCQRSHLSPRANTPRALVAIFQRDKFDYTQISGATRGPARFTSNATETHSYPMLHRRRLTAMYGYD